MTGADGLGRALAALSGEQPDVGDILAHLVADCAASSGARAVAVLARDEPAADLELLAASSHHAAAMEVWQAQHGRGPCVEAMDAARVVHRTAEAEGVEEGSLGALMRDAGFRAVSAYPVAWRGVTLAGLNLFWASDEGGRAADGQEPGRVYADLVALAIAHPALTDAGAVRAQLRRSMAQRAVVEQAKGVLAWTEGLDMGAAYARLLTLTETSSATLGEVAAEVVRRRGAPPA
ncbi:ANTAR domain-containing protein [Nocardioides sp. CFH 31398]|uniref:ANTAR domain-containing protein n=1 Tax=Nocardioides sp. CFH 31398 TaxID=2919579 RepID=UPI001F06E29F|nr:ANTAR domain-containing protein [Nocardioides sp. CFH 31398]MCH1868822.1 ANTAR domain-containing protein [Nocardioides sp. CFH 31398]